MTILTDIKKLLGITADYDPFDSQLLIHINTAMLPLHQLGIDGIVGLRVSEDTLWEEITGLQPNVQIEAIKSFVFYKVWLVFDPPASAVAESIQNQIKELEFRLYVEVDPPPESIEAPML